MFGAAMAFGRFLDREKRADALCFGLFAGLAILTKGTGIALVLMVPLSLLLTRRWQLLRRPILWGSAGLTGILAGPWTWHFRNEGRLKGGWLQPYPSWSFTRDAFGFYAEKFALGLGFVLLLLAIIGVVSRLRRRGEAAHVGRWSAAGALMGSVLIFQIIMPVGLEARHLIPALPAAMMFAIAGMCALGHFMAKFRRTAPMSSAHAVMFGALPVIIAFTLSPFLVPFHSKRWSGFGPLAEVVSKDGSHPKSTVLISSDGSGEGMFISELAMHEKRPGHTVQRASKLLASMAWSGAKYHARFARDPDLTAFLRRSEISWIVVDLSMPPAKRGAHHQMLARVCEENPDIFRLVGQSPIVRGGRTEFPPLLLYSVDRAN